ncbi:MAG: HDIG domain-containing protein [Nitrospiraceae bacterium]|nr:HDIG domain-containing protein [Nitrospiraceae bacterium]
MASRNETVSRLLPKMSIPEQERDDGLLSQRRPRLLNAFLALATSLILAYALLPRIGSLHAGDVAPRDIIAPESMYLEYRGPDETDLSSRVKRGEVLVEAGHRVSERAAAVIDEIRRREGIGSHSAGFAALTLLILLVFYLFYRDVKRYRPTLVSDTRKIILLAFLLLLTVAVGQFFRVIFTLIAGSFSLENVTVAFALPVSAGAMLVSLLLDFHLALAFSFIVSLLMGLVFPGDSFMPLYYFTGSIMAALHVIRCKKRTAVIRAGALTAVINIIAIIGIDLYRGELLSQGVYDALAGVVSAAITATIVSVMLPFFEAVFDIATDIKLLELMDPNHPLLKNMVYSSPGTYHHSIVIGNLAEAAAEAIGENALLARVGAYYHDIGKAQKPEYFIENQRHDENKHDRLSPSMSSLIIISHVKEGVELARQHKMPKVIVDIIRQHHGNSIITYFYQKAKELQPDNALSEQDFRYPGPRPRTKVAAIVMLADAVEAASRTLTDPSPQRIQGVTSSVITRIFLDDQLSMCDLTLKDLREIAKSFNLILNGIFHHRIEYPGVDLGGPKRRNEHPDKKHPEEAKAGAAGRTGTA